MENYFLSHFDSQRYRMRAAQKYPFCAAVISGIGGNIHELNSTPSSERVHIGLFGRRNAGKSSVVNRVTGQELSVVSDIKGTTTDPVTKAMELLPMGPVQIIDTPGNRR